MRRSLLALCVLATIATVTGCGKRKSYVFGIVTLDGKPLDNGTIQFDPADGKAPTAGAVISKEGKYRAEVSPTLMRVGITSAKVIGQKKMYDTPDSPMQDLYEDALPVRYANPAKSELTVTPVDGVETEFNFDLKSEPKKK